MTDTHVRLWAAGVRRIITQLSHDRRTVAIVLIVPLVLLTLLHEIYAEDARLASRVETQMLGVFPVFIMFLLTAVAMVRERTSGTLERLLTTRVGKADLLLAYGAGFGLLAAVQAAVMTTFCVLALGTDFAGPVGYVVLVSAVTALLGVSLGLLASAVSRSEFQAVQMFPVLVVPQILLCGLLGPRENMADWLYTLSTWLPLTYSIEALGEVSAASAVSGSYWRYVAILAGCVVGLLVLASTTLRRRTA